MRAQNYRFLATALVVGLVSIFAVSPSQPADAATDTVTTCSGSGAGSLPEVVGSAASGDTITFSVMCPLSSPIVLSSTIDITQNLTIDGPGATELAVSGNEAVGVFNIASGITVSISGLSVENGNAANGGGIYSDGGSLTLVDVTVSNNGARFGGGIYNGNDGTLIVTDSTLSQNTATTSNDVADGGGIFSDGGATITGSTLTGNSSTGTPGSDGLGDGGGIYNSGIMNIDKSSLSSNTSNWGGGGIDNATTLTITNSTLSNNSARGGGGGIISDGTLSVANSTLSDDSASLEGGGAIYGGNGTATVKNSTLTANSGRGSEVYNYNNQTLISVAADILAEGSTCVGSITDLGFNIEDDTACGLGSMSISGSSTLDGTLGQLADNGGPTETVALLSGSPAIDVVPAADCPATDQRGFPRTPPCDVGAYDTDGNFPAAMITKVKPARGKPGKKVTIEGTNLSGATVVRFNGTLAPIKTDTTTKITTTVPSSATSGFISVTTPSGTVTSTKSFKVT